MRKIYLYIRLSSADADLRYKTESESISHQRDLLRQFVENRKEFSGIPVEEFIDDGYSGTNDERPSFERMIERLKNGEADTVICKDFSRFFRDYTEIGDYLERIFPFLGVRFISVNDKYDSDDYKGTTAGMEVVMKYIIYAYYSKDLSQKIKTVMNVRKKRGEFMASKAPYGYMKDPDNKNHLVPDPVTSPVVRRIFDMALTGASCGEIARKLNKEGIMTPSQYFRKKFPNDKNYHNVSPENCWDNYSVRRTLERLEYTGAVVAQKRHWKGLDNPKNTKRDKKDWIIVPNRHEAIVSESEYDEVQKALRHNNMKTRGRRDFTLRTLLYCGICGRALTRESNVKKIYYRCTKSAYSSKTSCPLGERFYEKELEAAVIHSLRQMLALLAERFDQVEQAARKTKGTREYLRQNLLQIEKSIKQNNLFRVEGYEKYSDGEMSREEFLDLKNRLTSELSQLKAQQTETEKQLADLDAADDTELNRLGTKAKSFQKDEEFTNQVLLAFIERIYVYSGMRIEIKYRFSDELAQELAKMQQK